jgi:putative MATE family efflux protein
LLFVIQSYDRYLTGRFSDAHHAALTTAGYIYWFTTAYAVVVNAGATALVGRFVGAGDLPLARLALGQSILLAVIFGSCAAIAGLLGMPLLIATLQLPGEPGELATAYLTPLTALLPFYLVEAAGIAALVGAGDTRTGLKTLALVTVVNVPLATGLSHGWGPFPDLGFVGIAWGTALAHVIGCALVITTLVRGRAGLRLKARALLPNRDLMIRLLRVSMPAAFDSLSVGIFQFAFLGMVNALGKTAAAAHGIAIQWEAIGYLSGAAFGTATAALVGRALGAGRPDIAARSGWTAVIFGALWMSLTGVVFYLFAPEMFRIYVPDPAQGSVVEAGVPVLRLVAFAMPGLAACIILTQALRAAGDTRVPVIFTWIGFVFIRLPITYYLTEPELGYGWGLYGAWVAMFADIYIRGLFFIWRFATGRWKRVQV